MLPPNFNDVPEEENDYELIPKGTKAKLRIEVVRPESGSIDDFLHASTKTALYYIKFKVEIVSNPFEGRTFFAIHIVGIPGKDTADLHHYLAPGQIKAVEVGLSSLKSIIQSHRNIAPGDTKANCGINSYADFDDMEFAAGIGVDKGKDGYADKNRIGYIIRNNSKDYDTIMTGNTIISNKSSNRQANTRTQSKNQTQSYNQSQDSIPLDDDVPF